MDADREALHGPGEGRERLALVDRPGIWLPDLHPRDGAVPPDQAVLAPPLLTGQGEALLLLLRQTVLGLLTVKL